LQNESDKQEKDQRKVSSPMRKIADCLTNEHTPRFKFILATAGPDRSPASTKYQCGL